MKRKIRAVSFDFWNTMFRDLAGEAYQAGRLQHFLRVVRQYHQCSEEAAATAFEICSQRCTRIWLTECRTPGALERVEMVLAELSLTLEPAALAPLAKICGEMVYQYPPTLIEHVAEVLAALAPDYKLAVISDTGYASGVVLTEIMRRNQILEYFDLLTFSDQAGRSKPHESVFLSTVEGLGVEPAELLHIGDLENTDVKGARGVGAVAVLFAADQLARPDSVADYVIRSHQELLMILADLNSPAIKAAD